MKFLLPIGGVVEGAHGIITSPQHKGVPEMIKRGLPWAADLGCLDGPPYVKRMDFDAVFDWLETMRPYLSKCLFIAGFDVVADAEGTLEAYEEFRDYFHGWPLAYVVQNGAESLPIPDDCAAVFIGGDTEYKESMVAVSVIRRARAMGKHVHIGRVNWGRRYRLFRVLSGSEDFTCDGTRNKHDGVENTIRDWAAYEQQPALICI